PRNISTAMMYAFAQRADCTVWDEPFYAWYLKTTGIEHPMGDEVIAAGNTDAGEIIAQCVDGAGNGRLSYQKHMCQHMIDGLDRQWILKVTNAFLIRSPVRVLASYANKREEVCLADVGFVQQGELFDMVADHLGAAPPVIDCDLFLADPEGQLASLCARLGIAFDEKMLSWPAGPKPCDGVWAAHWYNAVWRSTGFATPPGSLPALEPRLAEIADAAMVHYEKLRRHAIGYC
ncbi:MAG TPA: HAD family hydrolase, partial [Rhizobiales bacterium]|nr:HAD family hydrolase [Hyphomicrobiales bacterium]